MRLPIANGRVKDCPPKPNGNTQDAAVYTVKFIRGATKAWTKASLRQTVGKVNSLI